MSTSMPTPSKSSSGIASPTSAPTPASKRQRVLACTLCQSRKVKCNRRFPCSNCMKSGAQCVPATLAPRQRRRRFSERELLDRLREYEALLRKHDIEFEPLNQSADEKEPSGDNLNFNSEQKDHPTSSRVRAADAKGGTEIKPKSFWQAMNQTSPSPYYRDSDEYSDADDTETEVHEDEVREDVVKKAWDQLPEANDVLLFGTPKTAVDLSTLHPEQVQIFRLWQIYLDNIDPILKVTHAPALQARILDAAGDVTNIPPPLEALMFSIYCVSLQSLDDAFCHSTFSSSKQNLMSTYLFGCQQALMNSNFLRTSDRDSLTAMLLYLVSIRPCADPRSISSLLGVAFRIAQRLGIHYESTHVSSKTSALEAELGRRLWWALVLYDNRISEMSSYKVTMLLPTWDCKIPTNVNDFEIRSEMKILPSAHEMPSEAIFAVVRGEIGDEVRKCNFHLDFSNPSLKAIVRPDDTIQPGTELIALEKRIEDRYLQHCNEENPVHFMTIWTSRGYLAKCRLIDHYCTHSGPAMAGQPDSHRDIAVSHAIRMLECDTILIASPLTKGFQWLVNFQFPFPAYVHVVQDLRRRPPVGEHAEKAWRAMEANYDVRFRDGGMGDNPEKSPLFRVFSKTVLHAWGCCEREMREKGVGVVVPRMIEDMRLKMGVTGTGAAGEDAGEPTGQGNMGTYHTNTTLPWDFGGSGENGMGGQGLMGYPGMFGVEETGVDHNQMDWMIDWNPMSGRGW